MKKSKFNPYAEPKFNLKKPEEYVEIERVLEEVELEESDLEHIEISRDGEIVKYLEVYSEYDHGLDSTITYGRLVTAKVTVEKDPEYEKQIEYYEKSKKEHEVELKKWKKDMLEWKKEQEEARKKAELDLLQRLKKKYEKE
jgi:hypothetical protein